MSFNIKIAITVLGCTLCLTSCDNVIGLQTQTPQIGIYQMDFKDEILNVLSESQNSQVILPILKPNYYTQRTFQLVCNATYPVQWTYFGSGAPLASATTSRIAPNENAIKVDGDRHNEIFQARVIFSSMDKTQEGNYSCESIRDPKIFTYMNLKVVTADSEAAKIGFVKHSKIQSKKRTNTIQILVQNPNRVICCSSMSNHFLKLRFMKCSSTSDCKLRQSYMENNHNCTQYYCNQDRVKRTEYKDGACSVFDMSNDHDDDYDFFERYDDDFQQGIFQCSDGGDSQNEYLTFTKIFDNSIVSNFNFPPQNTNQIFRLEIEETSNDNIFLICNVNSFFFSNGIKWAFQNSIKSELVFYDEANGRVSLMFPKEDVQGKIVHCFSPIWNSNDWKSASMFIS